MTMPNSISQNALTASGLIKKFQGITAVNHITLELKPGECVALLGPNGAGKTTTCEILEGLQSPDQGTVEIYGLNFNDHRSQILERIGVQLQETNLYKKYTVKETIELFSSFYKNSLPIEQLLDMLQLSDKANSRLEHLSGGQKQRVYLGCSLVNNPELIFLDEPTTGLDPQARRLIWDLIRNIKQDGRSVFLTTHYMEEAQELADRIAIMNQGEIIAHGTVEELLCNYAPEEVLSFKIDSKDKDTLEQELPWLKDAQSNGEQYTITVTNASTSIKDLIRYSDKLKLKISALNMRQSTLEDVFLKLTGRSIK